MVVFVSLDTNKSIICIGWPNNLCQSCITPKFSVQHFLVIILLMRKPTDLLFLSYSLTSSCHYFLLDAVVSDFVSSLYIQTLAKKLIFLSFPFWFSQLLLVSKSDANCILLIKNAVLLSPFFMSIIVFILQYLWRVK